MMSDPAAEPAPTRAGEVGSTRPARSDVCASANDPEHAWNRGTALWNLMFWFFMGLGLAILLAVDHLTPLRSWAGAAAIVVMCLAFVTLRPARSTGRLDRRTGGYLLIVIVGCGVACAADPSMSLLLFATCSQVWMFGGGTRTSAVLCTLLLSSTLIGMLTSDGWSLQGLAVLGTIMAISLAFSIVFGVWISRIIDQSRERAELISELEAARTQLGDSHHAQGVMAERERVAREIHDTLAQGYTSVIMLAQSAAAQLDRDRDKVAQRLASIEQVSRENLAEARALVAAFSPVELDGRTLVDAVRRLADRFGTETGLTVTLDLPASLVGLPRDREVVLLRAVQESLANVRRHARASSVLIRITVDAGRQARVEVTDNGVGFPASTEAGYGLTGMRHRVNEAGGALDVDSTPGSGTSIVVRLPATPVPS